MMKSDAKHYAVKSLVANIAYLERELCVSDNFDIIKLDLQYGGKKMALFTVDGLTKDEALIQIQKGLMSMDNDELVGDYLQTLIQSNIPYIEIDIEQDLNIVVDKVLT